MNTDNWLERTELLLGKEKLDLLRKAHVLVVGLGGVGAYAAEMIVRAGVGRMTIADADAVAPSNINRQLVALHSTVGRQKAEILAERLRDINPEIELTVVSRYIKDEETDLLLDAAKYDYAVDAIDTLSPKLALIKGAWTVRCRWSARWAQGQDRPDEDGDRRHLQDPPLSAGPHAAQAAPQNRRPQRFPGRLLARTDARRGADPLRGAEQEVERRHHILHPRAVRHRLRVGRNPRPDRRNELKPHILMKPNIVFLDEYTLGGADLGRLQALGEYKGYARTTPEELPDRCREADVIITNKVVLRRETLRSLPRLRLICVAATGTNNIDLEAAAELGIEVKNAAGYSTHSVAETTLGAAIALRRNIVYYDRYVKSGAYSAAGQQFHFALPTHQLYGSKWGIVGLGAIGREVARLAAAFGCEVCYTSTSGVVREEPYPALPLTELLGRSDIVSIHAPLNDRTRGLIGAPELSVMKRSALLINVARGGIVDEAALAEALDRGSIAGAALDVFSREPFAADSPLLGIREPDRLLLSPHNAWSPREAVDVLVGCVEENIKTFYGND